MSTSPVAQKRQRDRTEARRKVMGGRLSVICTERSESKKNKKVVKWYPGRKRWNSSALGLKGAAQVDEVSKKKD
jgi:hypothetical protein